MDATLIDEFAERYPLAPMRPPNFGMTLMELCSSKGIHKDQAESLLEKAMEEGALERTQMREEKKPGIRFVYYRPGAWPVKENE